MTISRCDRASRVPPEAPKPVRRVPVTRWCFPHAEGDPHEGSRASPPPRATEERTAAARPRPPGSGMAAGSLGHPAHCPPGSGREASVPLPHCPPDLAAAAIAAAAMPKRKKLDQQQPPPPQQQQQHLALSERDEPGDEDDERPRGQPSVNYSPEGRRGEKNYDGPTVKVRDWGMWNHWACCGCSTVRKELLETSVTL